MDITETKRTLNNYLEEINILWRYLWLRFKNK